jgi:hypothetical protein
MTRCTICNSEHRAAIDSLLDGGAFQRDVAAQFGVSRFALSRHLRHSNQAPVATADNGETLEAQAARWLQRADDIYACSTVNGDVRGQVQSLTAAFRGLELQHKSELRDAESPPPANGETPVTLEEIDRIVQRINTETERGRAFEKLYRASDRAIQLAARLADHPASWPAVETILESTRVN